MEKMIKVLEENQEVEESKLAQMHQKNNKQIIKQLNLKKTL